MAYAICQFTQVDLVMDNVDMTGITDAWKISFGPLTKS